MSFSAAFLTVILAEKRDADLWSIDIGLFFGAGMARVIPIISTDLTPFMYIYGMYHPIEITSDNQLLINCHNSGWTCSIQSI